MQPGRLLLILAGCLPALFLVSGCASWKSASKHNERLFTVKSESAAFYYYSPRQGNPDKTISRETPLHVLRPSFGFCKVRLLSGEEGYVANEDIGEGSSGLIAANGTEKVELRRAIPEPRPPVPLEPLPEFEDAPLSDSSNSGN